MPVISLDKIKNGAVLDDSIKQTAIAKSEAIQNQNLYISDLLKTEGNKPGSGFIGNTQTASGSEGKTTTPTPAKENLYDDLVNQKPKDYSPNAEGLANTGAGAEAAVGTGLDGKPIDYSWNKQGSEKAQKQYQSDVLAQKDKLLTQAQQTANNAVNYQTQSDMMKYQNNQNAEKVGWTGGYVLDQNKQTEYLKASIQAQMYGAMELQKYGYDSALAAARLSYDLNQQEYARQYYNDAVSAALSEAQLTGTYFSAETKDMMSQFAVAEQKLKDQTISKEERTKAESIINTINGWFSTNGISSAGVKTMAAYQFEAEQAFQWNTELYTRYQAAVQTLKQDQQNNPNMFFKLDENGNPIFDGMDVQTIDFTSQSIADAVSYAKTSDSAKQQLYSYFNWIMNDAIAKYKESVMTQDSNGKTTYQIKEEDFKKAIENATSEIAKYQNEANSFYDFHFVLTDSVASIKYEPVLNEDGTPKTDSDGNIIYNTEIEIKENSNQVNNGYSSQIQMVDASQSNWLDNVKASTPQFSLSSTPNNIGITASYQTDQINGSGIDDDFDYKIGKYKYDLDIDWQAKGSGWEEFWSSNQFSMFYSNDATHNDANGKHAQEFWDNCIKYLNKAYPNVKNGDLAFVNITNTDEGNIVWMYHNGKWGFIQKNADGKKLYADLKSFSNGSIPGNWK